MDGKHSEHMTKARLQLGADGEEEAVRFLRANGFRVLERNYRAPIGEIDLIVRRGAAMHFVEVKTRRSFAAGDPFEQVTARKQRQIIRTAMAYCVRHRLGEPEMHFDVVAVDQSGTTVAIDHLIDAFAADG